MMMKVSFQGYYCMKHISKHNYMTDECFLQVYCCMKHISKYNLMMMKVSFQAIIV